MYSRHNIRMASKISSTLHRMRSIISWICLLGLAACQNGPKDINTAEGIEGTDFVLSFPAQSLPIQYADRDLAKPSSDSFFVKPSVVAQFIPDSVFRSDFKSLKNVTFYRKARYTAEETEETYIFLLAASKSKNVLYLICFDPENRFSTAMEMLSTATQSGTNAECSIDRKLTIYKNTNRVGTDKKIYYNKNAYVYNTEGMFTLILTDSNEPIEKETVYNPIDTVAAKDPLSGDYKQDDLNFVAVRDGGKKGRLQFFISISKSSGKCTGTLRGDLAQVRNKVYHYNKADDHCILEFTFNGKRLQVKELEACGNHRGLRCSFDGKFNKR